MYGEFVVGDEESGGIRAEPGRVTDFSVRSEPCWSR